MKRFFTLFTLLALTSTVAVSAAESRLENYVNKKMAPITQKEKDFNAKVEADQQARAARRAEYQKEQAERQAKYQQQRKEAKQRREATNNAIKAERDYWRSLGK